MTLLEEIVQPPPPPKKKKICINFKLNFLDNTPR